MLKIKEIKKFMKEIVKAKKKIYTNYSFIEIPKSNVIFEDRNTINVEVNGYRLFLNKYDLFNREFMLNFVLKVKEEKNYIIFEIETEKKFELNADELSLWFEKNKYKVDFAKDKQAKIKFEDKE